MTAAAVTQVARLDLRFAPKPWAFAQQHRDEIAAYFEQLRRRKPDIWNGRVLLLHDYEIDNGTLRGAFLETDFASFIAWKDWGRPEAGVYDCFGAAAVESADGAFLLGVMGAHTAGAGQAYFPCGTPDPSDAAQGRVDFDLSVGRELAEETGLQVGDLAVADGWTLVRDGGLIAAIKSMRSKASSMDLRAQIDAFLKRETRPELAGVRLVRAVGELDAAVPEFVRLFLVHRWAYRDGATAGSRP